MLNSSRSNGLVGDGMTSASVGPGSTFSFEISGQGADPVSADLRPPQVISYEGPRRRVLVVDDEPLNRSILSALLSTVGFDAIEADSAEEALGLLKNHFDAVITDIKMPGYDGHALCRHLRLLHRPKTWSSLLLRPACLLAIKGLPSIPGLTISWRNR